MHDKAREITEPPSREADELLQADAAASMTVVAPPGEHALLTRLREARGASITKQIGAGIMLPIRALGLLRAHRELVPLVIIPVLINIVLFAISAYFSGLRRLGAGVVMGKAGGRRLFRPAHPRSVVRPLYRRDFDRLCPFLCGGFDAGRHRRQPVSRYFIRGD